MIKTTGLALSAFAAVLVLSSAGALTLPAKYAQTAFLLHGPKSDLADTVAPTHSYETVTLHDEAGGSTTLVRRPALDLDPTPVTGKRVEAR